MAKKEGIDLILIDDNKDDIRFIKMAIEELLPEERILCLKDGEKALEYFQELSSQSKELANPLPKLIITDLNLPRINGLEVVSFLRKDSTYKQVPIIVFTSSTDPRELVQAYEIGISSFVVKPLDFDGFSDAVYTVCNYWMNINRFPAK